MPINHTTPPSRDQTNLIVQFLADLMRATNALKDQTAFQQALQSYCDSLHPWLEPSDGPLNPRAIFSLLENCAFDESGEHMTVVLSPEAEALFRAWFRRNQIAEQAGLHTAHAWDN